VAPLSLIPDPTSAPVEQLAASPAVALFVERAQAVRHDFMLTDANAYAVAEICRRLEGLPLAIELAAARTRLLDPDRLLARLSVSLDALGTGPVDLPERQQTLRATVEWSVGLLDAAERSLLETAAVFADGWTVESAAAVGDLDEDRVLDLTEAMLRHSLIQIDHTEIGPRMRMLDTVREFLAERLAARPDVDQIRRRHADYYRTLAEDADDRRRRGDNEWLDLLEAEAGNLFAAAQWYMDHDRAPLPHLFRTLLSFLFLREHQSEARAWMAQLLPDAESFDLRSRVELLWTTQMAALDLGDDQMAVTACERIGPLLPLLDDSHLRSVARLAMAWTFPIDGRFEDALRAASASLDELRAEDEPIWTGLAAGSVGGLQLLLGRYDDAAAHIREARDLGDRVNSPWVAAWSRTLQGTLAVHRGQWAEAGPVLEEALDLSLAAHSANSVSLCLIAFARVALEAQDAERAALLMGAAEGMRRRVGLRTWPTNRWAEAELAERIRKTLGVPRFEQAYDAGTRLNRPEAVAAARELLSASAAS
jgi:hypothetical protein